MPEETLTAGAPNAPADAPSRLVRWGYPLLGVALVALYARTVAPGPTFSDGPEIVTGIVTLGVIHPTGYPLFTLVGHAFVNLLPLAVQPCVKVSLMNALFAGAAAIFTAHVARAMALLVCPAPAGERERLPEVARRGRPTADIAGLYAGLMLGTSPLVWDQVRIPEVYPFHLFLTAWALFSVMRFEVTRRPRYLIMGALAMGLGLAHHVTMVYMLPAAILYTLVREPSLLYGPFLWPVVRVGRLFKKGFFGSAKIERAWVFPVVAVVGFLPAFFYAYLLWADKHTTGLNWGGVKDWDGLYYHMMGKQYTKFMAVKDIGAYLTRIGKLPDVFDKQFLTMGTVLVFPGLVAAFRRAFRPALLLLFVVLFYFGHGVYYSVGDYQTYFLPAIMACSIFVGTGLDVVLRWALARAPEKRLFFCLSGGAVVFALASLSTFIYSLAQKRMPAALAKIATPAFVLPFAGLALALGVAAYVLRRRARKGLRAPRLSLGERLFPGLLLASAVLPLPAAVAARVSDIDDRQVVGDSYGREVMENAPPGSIVMVQGDGYLFTLWYQTHAMNRGTDAAIIDVGSLGAQWYKRYLTSHYPAACDPLLPEFVLDRAAYEAKCKTFRQRMDLGATQPWITMGERRSKSITAGERAKGTAMLKDWLSRSSGRIPRLPHNDARCDDPDFKKGHSKECRCYYDPKRDPNYTEDCVFSADEGGIVPRERAEIWLQHLVEEHIDERPVFERNLFTHSNNNAGDNHRGWSGPDYQRISGEYALLNRGRVNQVLYATEVSADPDACRPVRAKLDLRRSGPKKGPSREARPYRPNEWPTLITASYLSRAPDDGDDSATRSFTAGDEVRVHLDWFEKNRYDYWADGHKGTAIKHGIRLCIFDGKGKKAGAKTTVSGRKDTLGFKLPGDAAAGEYHLAACSVGEVGDTPKFPEEMPCKRLILEYSFSVAPRAKTGK